ncbi:LLM class flavin-dependent oxidoreductase [Cryobacterium sp.]|uniref:LLM class flavin-dependent oxidoreductase n=1 Tax=Cryobacterium sp. TaxID=1926290 RepID=UPI00261CC257|nr:LLM class flavin-dependent oxidoreductase [Cryobacterium sp.]MCU1446424.1 putative monooxygenase [Cryobacterium sp.]
MPTADPAPPLAAETGTQPLVLWSVEGGDLRRQLASIAELDAVGVDAVVLPGGSLATADPILIAGAASRRAPRVGLIASLSPWLQPPFHTARVLGTLDALTRGRAGWLVDPAPTKFSATDDTDRWTASGVSDLAELDRAFADYLAAAAALWNSWQPGALVADVGGGQYVDPAKVQVPHYRGEFFSVRGPLNMPRSPQGRPVILARWPIGAVVNDTASSHADVLIVSQQADVSAARNQTATVLLELHGTAAGAPPATTADGYLISGVSDPALYGHVVHTVLPGLLPPTGRRGLLRERLRLPADAFDWTAPNPNPTPNATSATTKDLE